MIDAFLRWFYRQAAALAFRLVAPYTIEGLENLPDPDDGPYLVIANHFSYFEGPLMGITFLHDKVRFFAAPDTLGEFWLIDSVYHVHRQYLIMIQRGVVDRQALQAGVKTLNEGNWLVIFPEGGITDHSIDIASQGESTTHLRGGYYTREPAELLPARPGTALLATQTEAKILPMAFIGTEHVEGNLRNFRRSRLILRIGKPLPAMTMPEGLRGRERRAHIDRVSDEMMFALADLMPEENKGPYKRDPAV